MGVDELIEENKDDELAQGADESYGGKWFRKFEHGINQEEGEVPQHHTKHQNLSEFVDDSEIDVYQRYQDSLAKEET